MDQRVVIAGGGAVGLATAAIFARHGVKVVLCDAAALGDNASGVAAGMLAPAMETAFDVASAGHFRMLAEARDLWPAFAQVHGVELDFSGAVAVGAPDVVETWAARLTEAGAPFERLTAEEAAGLVPGIAPGLGGLRSREDLRLRSLQALAALRDSAGAHGAEFIAAQVVGWDGREALLDDGRKIAADKLVIATGGGHGLEAVAPELSTVLPIKGQIAQARDVIVDGPVLRGEGIYICPSPDGLIVGATMEQGRADRDVDPEVIDALTARATRLLPALDGAKFEASAAVRGATADGLPLVGPVVAPGVILAVGARRNGWLLAPVIANMIAAYVNNEDAGPLAARFDPRRF
ncbi:FAD-dependent oxidoreductase [Caulobacter segnis]|uniref:NAD(P)/FAD-dependent oxidoreductase n=1 Tax=Caulobacter segnis TaxID=88688 RepID=UPI00240EFEA6|nr:FAD-dependent oxidoreductase [Caulobacter segnis]MDG2522865.1 FAD-dependent oxidoreductase [Caulobacter segnis]